MCINIYITYIYIYIYIYKIYIYIYISININKIEFQNSVARFAFLCRITDIKIAWTNP